MDSNPVWRKAATSSPVMETAVSNPVLRMATEKDKVLRRKAAGSNPVLRMAAVLGKVLRRKAVAPNDEY